MFDSSINLQTSQAAFPNAQADRLLSNARSATSTATSSDKDDAKIEKAGKDFESILIGSWLQKAEESFAKVPGGDGQEDDDDSGKDQFQGIAMQALAGKLTDSGGIGIAKMITSHLRASAHHESGSDSDTKVAASAGQLPGKS